MFRLFVLTKQFGEKKSLKLQADRPHRAQESLRSLFPAESQSLNKINLRWQLLTDLPHSTLLHRGRHWIANSFFATMAKRQAASAHPWYLARRGPMFSKQQNISALLFSVFRFSLLRKFCCSVHFLRKLNFLPTACKSTFFQSFCQTNCKTQVQRIPLTPFHSPLQSYVFCGWASSNKHTGHVWRAPASVINFPDQKHCLRQIQSVRNRWRYFRALQKLEIDNTHTIPPMQFNFCFAAANKLQVDWNYRLQITAVVSDTGRENDFESPCLGPGCARWVR